MDNNKFENFLISELDIEYAQSYSFEQKRNRAENMLKNLTLNVSNELKEDKFFNEILLLLKMQIETDGLKRCIDSKGDIDIQKVRKAEERIKKSALYLKYIEDIHIDKVINALKKFNFSNDIIKQVLTKYIEILQNINDKNITYKQLENYFKQHMETSNLSREEEEIFQVLSSESILEKLPHILNNSISRITFLESLSEITLEIIDRENIQDELQNSESLSTVKESILKKILQNFLNSISKIPVIGLIIPKSKNSIIRGELNNASNNKNEKEVTDSSMNKMQISRSEDNIEEINPWKIDSNELIIKEEIKETDKDNKNKAVSLVSEISDEEDDDNDNDDNDDSDDDDNDDDNNDGNNGNYDDNDDER